MAKPKNRSSDAATFLIIVGMAVGLGLPFALILKEAMPQSNKEGDVYHLHRKRSYRNPNEGK